MNDWAERWLVSGSTGSEYVVARRPDGTFGCSCPGWKFKKAPKPDCKHIRAMREAVSMQPAALPYDLKREAERAVARGAVPKPRLPAVPRTIAPPAEVSVAVEVEGLKFNVIRKFRFAEE